ncbi:hypothetical protein [Prevotella jejuni]
MKHLLLILLTALCYTCCYAQKDKKTTTKETKERFDVNYYKNIIKNKKAYEGATVDQYVEGNSTKIYVSFDDEHYVLQEIKPLTYNTAVSNSYKNCILKSNGEMLCRLRIKSGIWREYNNQGKLIKETDEDKKFEKLRLKPINIQHWLERRESIDSKIGIVNITVIIKDVEDNLHNVMIDIPLDFYELRDEVKANKYYEYVDVAL